MDFFKKINAKAKSDENTGFGTNSSSYGGRFINKDGSANIERKGLNFFERTSWFHTFIEMSRLRFFAIIVGFYIFINFVFACLYYIVGLEFLSGINPNGTEFEKFGKAYFFSAQTFTTVGYGHISPNGFLTSLLSASEALVGLLSFAIATGLFFGRFSKPKAFLKFSHNILMAPYKDGKALMLRMTPFKNTNFTDAEAKITLGMQLEENGKIVNKFYQLELELYKINALTLSWTLVHPITENSPLYGFSKEDFKSVEGEFLVFIKTFDEMFSTTVGAKTSYTFDELIYGAKFQAMFHENEDKTKTILNLHKLNVFDSVELE